ncbi:phosphotransferase family protein [Xanthobacter sp. DSM 14520]|uniref:phosphotransferase family protein n=1 Tax=Xanthobacter autotrophicus (strain ATCC BAA-1158 / Py2) TaxID=78245 RepID=UPI00372A6E5E
MVEAVHVLEGGGTAEGGVGTSVLGPAPPAGVALRSAAESRALDWPAIGRHLAAHGIRLDPAFVPRQFTGGLANLNFLLRVSDGWAVLRRPPDGALPPGAHDMAREHRILSNLWRELPLAPRSLHLCADASVAGAPFQVMEFRAGIALRGDSLSPFPATAATGADLSQKLVETLAAIHAVDPTRIGLSDLGRPAGFFARTAAGWIGRAERVAQGALSPAARAVAGWLAAAEVRDASAPTLLHNDFKLDNVLLDPATRAPVAVVDWDMGTRGDPLFDLATLLSYWTEAGDPPCMHELAQMPTARPGFLTRAEAADAYARATGRDLSQLKVYRVLTMLKLGVVFHQLHARHLAGETADPRYAGFGTLAEALFDFTLDIINDKTF